MRTRNTRHRLARAILFAALVVLGNASPAGAVTPAPHWTLESFPTPTVFSPDDNSGCETSLGSGQPKCDTFRIYATDAGRASTDGSEIVLRDTLPSGVTAREANLAVLTTASYEHIPNVCTIAGSIVTCEYPGSSGARRTLSADVKLNLSIYTTVDNSVSLPSTLVNHAEILGGGAPAETAESTNLASLAPAPFGPDVFSAKARTEDGAVDSTAGDHPYEFTTVIGLDNEFRFIGPETDGSPEVTGPEDLKDIVVDLPLGFIGSTLAAPECTLTQMSAPEHCPPDTIIGQLTTEPESNSSVDSPIYNLVPEEGHPAEFGYIDSLHGAHVIYTSVVPTPHGYVLQTVSPNLPNITLARIVATFYGDPAAKQIELARLERKQAEELPEVPFFTNPSDCSGEPLTTTLHVDSWQNPARVSPEGSPVDLGEPQWRSAQSTSPPVSGCNALAFSPEVIAQPTTHEADKPSGLNFEIKVPQSETVGAPATPTMKKAVVTFPEGFTLDPSAGDGLAACSEAQIGWLGGSHLDFDAALPECPEASKIGTLELETPLIPHELEGDMYLARQNENPFDATIGLYVVVDDPSTGVLVKIPGKTTMDPHTGRVTAEFDENPNLPFSDLKLHFFGGPRAEFATPESCGTFTTHAELLPYSFPDSGPAATPFDSFSIDEACPGGFSPSFTAGSTNLQAGAFTPFVVSFSRSDTDQELAGLSVTLPQGLLGKLAGLPLCGEAEANAGTCPEASQVGTVKAGAGPGPNPLFVTGKAYLTGPYNGGPYGLSVVVPAVAGPFNFGTAVVRQSIRINPLTAQVTDVSDPFPKIIDGIPLRLRRIDVELNRPGFTFNPTNCDRAGFAGAITGSPLGAPTELRGTVGYATQAGSSSAVSAPFQVTDCQALKFTPDFKSSVTGKTSKEDGAALSVKLSYPAGSMGSQANIAHVKVELPKQLPSRLTTLQQACLAATFEANPASCPAHSLVGHARVVTPVLSGALEGPAYFVSHGSEEFPNLTLVLQGGGVTVELVGSTFISKAGITSTTFKATPDVPFSTFELTLPQGPFSALAASANLCQAKSLAMPTEFTAQNGATLDQATPIEVTGCPTRLALIAHKHKGHSLVLSVYVPAAGKVKASGSSIHRTSKTTKAREVITLTVPLDHGGRSSTKLKLAFTPSKEPQQTQSVALYLHS